MPAVLHLPASSPQSPPSIFIGKNPTLVTRNAHYSPVNRTRRLRSHYSRFQIPSRPQNYHQTLSSRLTIPLPPSRYPTAIEYYRHKRKKRKRVVLYPNSDIRIIIHFHITSQPWGLVTSTGYANNPHCHARSIELANTIIFQAATDFAHIGALIMTTIMILHVRSKFTAVGRKEILTFFYIYLGLTCVSLVLDAGVIPATNGGVFPYFVAIQNGFVGALCMCLLINGFVGFQLYEDGTTLSVWLLRGTCLGLFTIDFAVSLITFKGWAGLGPENTTVLFVVVYLINALFLFVYVVMQFFLVFNTLQDRWPIGDLIFGTLFLVAGQVLLYAVGTTICEATSHYLDAVFFATVCNLLAVMMVYKYWDSITKEDLEFSVGTKQGNWEVNKDPLMGEDSTENIESLSKRASFYNRTISRSGSRASYYENQSFEYNPRPASSHHYLGNNSNPRLSGHGYAQLISGAGNPNTSYGDVRRSASLVNENQEPRYQPQQQPRSEQYRPVSSSGPPLRHLEEYEAQRRQDELHAGGGYGKQYQHQQVGSGVYTGGHRHNNSSVRDRSAGRPHSRMTSGESRYERW